jgi:hypothetical protein
MRRTVVISAVALSVALSALVPTAGATIHPIVESFDCANAQAFAHHPIGDPADPAGQTPGDVNPAGQETGSTAFTALDHAADSAFSEHKLNGECGTVGQP